MLRSPFLRALATLALVASSARTLPAQARPSAAAPRAHAVADSARAARAPGIFDVHLHAYATKGFRGLAEPGHGAFSKTRHSNVVVQDSLLPQTLRAMDGAGVRRGLLSGDNDLVVEWATRHPDRFLPSFTPSASAKTDHAAAARQFEAEVRAGRWYALGEMMNPYSGRALNDTTFYPYYAAAERLGVPVLFHTGEGGPDPQGIWAPKFRIALADARLLEEVAIRFPTLKIVAMHLGWPDFDHALYLAFAYPNVYLDVATSDWLLGRDTFDRMLRETVAMIGSDRVLFGSDQMVWPQQIPVAVRTLREARYLTAADRENIFWRNAERLLDRRAARADSASGGR